jgi:Secreted repeat of unknown function
LRVRNELLRRVDRRTPSGDLQPHPLYRFAKDTKEGQTNGEEFNAFGAKWYVVSPAGNKIVKSGGGGYLSGSGYAVASA